MNCYMQFMLTIHKVWGKVWPLINNDQIWPKSTVESPLFLCHAKLANDQEQSQLQLLASLSNIFPGFPKANPS